ncbi:hypothetical protein Ahy_B01g056645 [Arachis hypogaea]|uniref:Aminotransferase-like plant mobile domain-containing protein n=1 Tax=Arachis hypogaea TaxID=3818 RepID=A0A445AZC8_ARAHY|nr:hypothetical protein Ahy_B01g056645 [Arachis hypogaea]
MGDDPGRLYRLDGVAHIAGVINDEETFAECPEGVDEETVRRYARAYIMMLLGTQLFADKSGNHIHIRWLPFVAESGMDPMWDIHRAMLTPGLERGLSGITSLVFQLMTRLVRRLPYGSFRDPCFQSFLPIMQKFV